MPADNLDYPFSACLFFIPPPSSFQSTHQATCCSTSSLPPSNSRPFFSLLPQLKPLAQRSTDSSATTRPSLESFSFFTSVLFFVYRVQFFSFRAVLHLLALNPKTDDRISDLGVVPPKKAIDEALGWFFFCSIVQEAEAQKGDTLMVPFGASYQSTAQLLYSNSS